MGIVERVFYNDQLPGIHLIKVDSADLSKPIANVKFRIEAVDKAPGDRRNIRLRRMGPSTSPSSPWALMW